MTSWETPDCGCSIRATWRIGLSAWRRRATSRAYIASAIAHKPAEGQAWMPEQRLRRDEALHAYTAGAAWAEFAETHRGCIREGFDADLTVFSRDVMAVHVDEIRSVPVAATVVRGRVVYAGGGHAGSAPAGKLSRRCGLPRRSVGDRGVLPVGP